MVLLFRHGRTVLKTVKHLKKGGRANFGEFVVYGAVVIAIGYLKAGAEIHIAGIQTLFHFHNRNAGLFFACHNTALDRSGASVCGEEGSMNINAAVFRIIEHVLGKYLSVCRNDYCVGCAFVKDLLQLAVFKGKGLINGKFFFKGKFFYGSRHHNVSSAARLVLLCNNGANRML